MGREAIEESRTELTAVLDDVFTTQIARIEKRGDSTSEIPREPVVEKCEHNGFIFEESKSKGFFTWLFRK